jgi:hypothetical protein
MPFGPSRAARSLVQLDGVAGIAVGFEDRRSMTPAAVAVLGLADLQRVELCLALRRTSSSYVPGLAAVSRDPSGSGRSCGAPVRPGLLIYDDPRLAHPKRSDRAGSGGGCSKCHWRRQVPSFAPVRAATGGARQLDFAFGSG